MTLADKDGFPSMRGAARNDAVDVLEHPVPTWLLTSKTWRSLLPLMTTRTDSSAVTAVAV